MATGPCSHLVSPVALRVASGHSRASPPVSATAALGASSHWVPSAGLRAYITRVLAMPAGKRLDTRPVASLRGQLLAVAATTSSAASSDEVSSSDSVRRARRKDTARARSATPPTMASGPSGQPSQAPSGGGRHRSYRDWSATSSDSDGCSGRGSSAPWRQRRRGLRAMSPMQREIVMGGHFLEGGNEARSGAETLARKRPCGPNAGGVEMGAGPGAKQPRDATKYGGAPERGGG